MMKRPPSVNPYFEALYSAWGPQRWWPADSPFEIILGAFLTQNTAWTNVERAMANLHQAGCLSADGIRRTPLEELERLVRPAGYFRQKAARLKTFIAYLDTRYKGSLPRMFAQPTQQLRTELLELNGVGPETADSILLYAGQHEVFVVDTYTRRIFERHALIEPTATYEDIRLKVESDLRESASAPQADSPATPDRQLPNHAIAELPDSSFEPGPGPAIEAPELTIPPIHAPSKMSKAKRSPLAQRFNEFHGLIVQVGKHHCLKQAPHCDGCPLALFLPAEGPRTLPQRPQKERKGEAEGRAKIKPARH